MKTNWSTKKLGELCHIYGGDAAPQDKSLFKSGLVPFVRMQDLGRYHITLDLRETTDKLTTSAIQRLGLKVWKPGVILIPRSGSVYMNHRAILGIDAVVVSHIAILSDFSKEILPHYLFYYLTTVDMGKYGTKTTGIDSISFSQLGRIKIPFPSLKIQKQIVGRLDKIAEAQKLNDELIQKANELFQSLLHKELSPTSKRWEFKKLGDVCKKIKQAHPSRFFKESFHYIDISSIDSESKSVYAFSTCSVEQAPSRARKLIQKNDILFATTRPYLENIAVVPGVFKDFIASTGFCVIRADAKYTIPEFLFFNVISKPFIKKALLFQRGANYPAISDKDVYGIKIPLPPLKIQKQIVAKLSAAQEYKTQLLAQKSKLKELFDSVLAKSFKGV